MFISFPHISRVGPQWGYFCISSRTGTENKLMEGCGSRKAELQWFHLPPSICPQLASCPPCLHLEMSPPSLLPSPLFLCHLVVHADHRVATPDLHLGRQNWRHRFLLPCWSCIRTLQHKILHNVKTQFTVHLETNPLQKTKGQEHHDHKKTMREC